MSERLYRDSVLDFVSERVWNLRHNWRHRRNQGKCLDSTGGEEVQIKRTCNGELFKEEEVFEVSISPSILDIFPGRAVSVMLLALRLILPAKMTWTVYYNNIIVQCQNFIININYEISINFLHFLFRGNVDRFEFSSKNVGDIAAICLGHTPKDGKKVKGEAYWHVEEVVVTEKELGNK